MLTHNVGPRIDATLTLLGVHRREMSLCVSTLPLRDCNNALIPKADAITLARLDAYRRAALDADEVSEHAAIRHICAIAGILLTNELIINGTTPTAP
jgi:hypothetical protein